MSGSVAIAIPFSLNDSGVIASAQSEVEQLSQRVTALASTQLGERVMAASFGVDTASLLFALGDPMATERLTLALGSAMQIYEPGAVLTSVRPVANSSNTGIARIVAQAVPASTQGTSSAHATIAVRADGTVITTP